MPLPAPRRRPRLQRSKPIAMGQSHQIKSRMKSVAKQKPCPMTLMAQQCSGNLHPFDSSLSSGQTPGPGSVEANLPSAPIQAPMLSPCSSRCQAVAEVAQAWASTWLCCRFCFTPAINSSQQVSLTPSPLHPPFEPCRSPSFTPIHPYPTNRRSSDFPTPSPHRASIPRADLWGANPWRD